MNRKNLTKDTIQKVEQKIRRMIIRREAHRGKARQLYQSFLVAILLFSLISSALAQDNGNSKLLAVTAAVPRNFPPHYAVDESGKPVGFAIDVMDRIAIITGLKVTYLIMDSWTDVSEAVKDGRADLIPNIGITASRMAWLDYTNPVETFSVSIFVRNQTHDIRGADDLIGHKVAAVKFNVGVNLLKDREGIDLKVFPHASDAIFKLLGAHVDALVYPVPVLMKMVQEAGVEHRIKTIGKPLLEIKRAVGVRKGNAVLLQKLNRAVTSFVGTPEYQKIYVKWFGKPSPFWTTTRLLCVMAGVVLSIFIIMFVWRYHSVSRLNRRLIDTNAELRQAETELRRSNRALRVLSESNQAVIHATAEPDLLREICRIIVEDGGYRLAWVGFAEEDENKPVRPVAQWGYEDGYLETLNVTWADKERSRGPTGRAIRTRKVCICKDILNDPSFAPWRKEARERGYSSLISLPLIVNGQCAGALTVYAVEPDAFDIDEEELLTELSDDLAFGIKALRNRAERKQAEARLRESEAKHRALLEQIPAITYTAALDEASTTLYVSPQIEAILGLSPEEYKNDPNFWQKHLHPEDRESVFAEIARTHETGQPFAMEYRMVTKDGREVWLRDEGKIIKDEHGSPLYLQGIMFDITESKRAEERIKEYSENLEKMVGERTKELNRALYDAEQARDRIDGILKSVGDGLIVTDLYNRVILMNRAAEDLLGVRLSEVIDRPIDFAIEDKTLRERIKNTLDKKQEGYEFDFELSENDSENPRIIRARTSIIEDKSGTHIGIITIMHDVTYEREVDRMKTEFISTAAHELRTPLTSIQGFSELLTTRDDITEEEKKECLSYINIQSVNLANIINDLLDISRIESGKGFSLDKESCNIAELIGKTVPSFHVQSKKHQFDLILPEEPIEVMADIDKMRQVLENILSNAVKYSPGGGTIRITGNVVEDHYQVSIEDRGIGMTPEQVEKIFDKFYRADASNTAIPGTGLGMSIVKYLVEAHGGEVWVESTQGKGTTVRFTIPV